MKNKFEYTPLGKVAQIDISGVDKKVKENERQVRLCNFVDVYHNWAITQDLYKDFMIASANEREIDLFKIKKGQVAITKDSETRDDIGIATYIADDFQDVILGYHTALITPNEKFLNGKFLNAFLQSSTAKKHFENNASGSGQRYTLTNDSISSIKVPLYDIKTQEKIGNLFTLIDKKIVNNNKMNKILENLAKTIYYYWFVQYEFPNKEGKPYKSSGGEIIYSQELKREKPKDWTVGKISTISSMISGYAFKSQDYVLNGIYKLYTIKNVQDGYINANVDNRINVLPKEINKECKLKPKDLIMSLTGNVGRVGLVYEENTLLNQRVLKIIPNEKYDMFIYQILRNNAFKEIMQRIASGTSQKNLSPSQVANFEILLPPIALLDKFNILTKSFIDKIVFNYKENQKLIELRDFLLPLLMNGQVTIKEAEEKFDQTLKEENITIFPNYDLRFELWLQNQGLAARGDIDRKTLREIFDAMDDNDK